MNILPILEELNNTKGAGSAKRKIKILQNNKENQDLKSFFFWCLDPNINFWQTKIKKYDYSEKIAPITLAEAINKTKILRDRTITGNKAIEYLSKINASLSKDDQNVFNRIIARKPGCGVNSSTANKVWPDLIYSPAYMRCKGFDEKIVKKWGDVAMYSQVKSDGMFLNCILHEKEFETRSGEKIDLRNENIDKGKRLLYNKLNISFGNPVLHGEITCWKDGKPIERSKSNGIINHLKQGGVLPSDIELVIDVWDVIPYNNFINKIPCHIPYSSRFESLYHAIKELHYKMPCNSVFKLIETKKVFSIAEAKLHFLECVTKSLEGTVLKNENGIWKSYDSPDQLKMKNEFSFELRIIGFKEGKGKFASTFGSIEAISEDGLLETSISGMTDAIRKKLNSDRDHYINKIVEVEAGGLFKNDDGSYGVMHPRFLEVRDDKTEADTLERIIQQEYDSIHGE